MALLSWGRNERKQEAMVPDYPFIGSRAQMCRSTPLHASARNHSHHDGGDGGCCCCRHQTSTSGGVGHFPGCSRSLAPPKTLRMAMSEDEEVVCLAVSRPEGFQFHPACWSIGFGSFGAVLAFDRMSRIKMPLRDRRDGSRVSLQRRLQEDAAAMELYACERAFANKRLAICQSPDDGAANPASDTGRDMQIT